MTRPAELPTDNRPKKPTLRRFTWCRIHHELLRKPLWRLVARMAGAPVPHVKLLVVELDLYASENVPRGSVEGFNVAALAADWGLASDDQLARIYAALEHPEVGWIDQDFIVTFWERNPDAELTEREREQNRLRQQKARHRRKEKKEAPRQGYPPSRVTQRDSVTSRTRSDQIIEKVGGELSGFATPFGAVAPPQGTPDKEVGASTVHSNSGEIGDGLTDREEAELWIAHEGARIIMSRAGILYPSRAKFELERLRKQIGDDVVALAHIIAQADTLEHGSGGRFLDWLRQAINQHRRDSAGQLPLSLKTSLKRSGAS